MSQLFNRKARLLVAKQVPESAKNTIATDVIEIQDHRVVFSVEKSTGKEPNTASVSVYNLSPSSRGYFEKRGAMFYLECGYAERGTKRLFSGNIRTCDHVIDGADIITTIKSGDGERAFAFVRTSRAYAGKVNALVVIEDLCSDLGFGVVNTTLVRKTFNHGISLYGSAQSQLDKVVKACGLTYSVQDGLVELATGDTENTVNIPELSPTSGLIGSPEFGAPATKGAPPTVTLKCLLNVDIKPRSVVKIRSLRLNGFVRSTKVKYTGDTHGADWYCAIEGEARNG